MESRPLLVRMALGEAVERCPVWLMRQAGRYLPEYRRIRERYSFLEMARLPEVAVDVTLQPLRRFALDGAIVFSDILVVPEALGIAYDIAEGSGPVFAKRVESHRDVAEMRAQVSDVTGRLDYFYSALRMLRQELPSLARDRGADVPALLGFAGAPWTLACYLVEGRSKTDLERAKAMAYENRELFSELIAVLEEAVVQHLQAQIDAGAQMVQLFESFAGAAPWPLFEEFCLKPAKRIVARLRSRNSAAVSYFARGAGGFLSHLSSVNAHVQSVDWATDVAFARRIVGPDVCLQGNLDPSILLASPEIVRREVAVLLERVGSRPRHIVNLGHGVVPQSKPDNVAAMVDAVHALSPALFQ